MDFRISSYDERVDDVEGLCGVRRTSEGIIYLKDLREEGREESLHYNGFVSLCDNPRGLNIDLYRNGRIVVDVNYFKGEYGYTLCPVRDEWGSGFDVERFFIEGNNDEYFLGWDLGVPKNVELRNGDYFFGEVGVYDEVLSGIKGMSERFARDKGIEVLLGLVECSVSNAHSRWRGSAIVPEKVLGRCLYGNSYRN